MNPPSGGSPAIEAAAMVAITAVTGIALASPPSRRISRVPVSWSTIPAAMNSAALKAAWLRMCSTAASAAISRLKPSSITNRPSWLMVE